MISAKPLRKPDPMVFTLPKPDPRAYRPRRAPVTVANAFVYDDGIVFCADTKVTNTIKLNESKLPFFLFC
jgi:hypothetical protein